MARWTSLGFSKSTMPAPWMRAGYLGAAYFVKEDAGAGHGADVFEERLVSEGYLEVAGHHGVVQVAHEDAVRPLFRPVLALVWPLVSSILLGPFSRRLCASWSSSSASLAAT